MIRLLVRAIRLRAAFSHRVFVPRARRSSAARGTRSSIRERQNRSASPSSPSFHFSTFPLGPSLFRYHRSIDRWAIERAASRAGRHRRALCDRALEKRSNVQRPGNAIGERFLNFGRDALYLRGPDAKMMALIGGTCAGKSQDRNRTSVRTKYRRRRDRERSRASHQLETG